MRLLLLPLVVALLQAPIITRHDVPDQRYLAFADSLSITAAVIKYNATDLAGTLIASNWVLSAAHVAETLNEGDTLRTVHSEPAVVASVVLHPGWLENGRPEDIALIELEGPLSHLPTVDVHTGREEAGQTVILIGNGDSGTGLSGPERNDGRMRAATNRVDGVTEAYLTWGFENPETSDLATELEGISGPGDSSGPALIKVGERFQIVGVSSGQSTAATGGLEGRYGVTEYYSRVSSYADWITATISR